MKYAIGLSDSGKWTQIVELVQSTALGTLFSDEFMSFQNEKALIYFAMYICCLRFGKIFLFGVPYIFVHLG